MLFKLSVLVLMLTAAMPPAFAARRVTVQQLEQVLSTLQHMQDGDIARQLSELQLTERLSRGKYELLKSGLQSEKSRQAFAALADESEFLSLPSSEIPNKSTPDLTEQRRIMGLVVAYVSKSVPQLPNFMATRQTTRFQNTPQRQGSNEVQFSPLHPIDTFTATVLYRDGREMVDQGTTGEKDPSLPQRGLSSWGEFGPILSTVLLDAAQNKLSWSHWEESSSGPLAVFAYSVPKEKSHYEVDYCCILNSEETSAHVFHELVGYHGEITVDAESGVIQRLKIEADLRPGEPVSRAALLVEYAPVKIGGKIYICPVRSIADSRAQSETQDKDIFIQSAPHSGAGAGGMSVIHTNSLTPGPEQTLLNDTTFVEYHVFRADSRVLADAANDLSPRSAAPKDEAASGPTSSPVAHPLSSSEDAAKEPQNSPAVPLVSTPPASATSIPLSAPSVTNADQRPIPEISVADATALPEVLPHVTNTGFTIRATSRLVDVTIMAFDKKGHPVTNLLPGEIEIYDNGRKQEVTFFSQASAQAPLTSSASTMDGASGGDLSVYTNRARPERNSSPEANTTVLLVDASNVAFADLAYARREILRFLSTVPPTERVGFYVAKSYGFEIHAEPTTDRARLEAELSKWIPSAQDLARAQDEERRNRQQLDWVHSVYDMAYVNGNASRDPATFVSGSQIAQALAAPVDAQLQELGNSPQGASLLLLDEVARHLAVLPGHKNLVWVTSDNALADWSNQVAARNDKGNKFIDAFAVNVQETLNNAHVSIYPLDASQLEAGGIGADIGTRNVLPIGKSDRDQATSVVGDAAPGMKPGRATAQMQQDTNAIQGTFRELAQATGGRALRRAGDLAAELDHIAGDGRAAYTLSFTPDQPADDSYHHLIVKAINRNDIKLRYRTGYLYSKELSTLKERFRQSIWQPSDVNEITVTASRLEVNSKGSLLKLNIAGTDLELAQIDEHWDDKLDIFLVERDDASVHAKVTGQTLSLRLKAATYQKILKEGIFFDQRLQSKPVGGTLRVVVVDENSGRMGSITLPAEMQNGKR
ncbi:MAG: VWA domain-containing protein [Terracidiphilus sp.]|nr:VWA domain-containing protein [Terracidiphilus sp.]